MNFKSKDLLLYAITDRRWEGEKSLYEQVEEALKGGVTILQIREKNMPTNDFIKEAREIKKLCDKYDVPLIINDNVEVALEIDADGVHVGQSDMGASNVRKLIGSDKILGVSARTVEEALEAQKNGADYLGIGSAFSTSTKTDIDLLAHSDIKKICEKVSIPVVAIGGISKDNILELSGLGLSGVSIISAIFGVEGSIEEECKKLKELASKITGF